MDRILRVLIGGHIRTLLWLFFVVNTDAASVAPWPKSPESTLRNATVVVERSFMTPLTNEQARQNRRDAGKPCVADGHCWERQGDWFVCRIPGCDTPPVPADPAPRNNS